MKKQSIFLLLSFLFFFEINHVIPSTVTVNLKNKNGNNIKNDLALKSLGTSENTNKNKNKNSNSNTNEKNSSKTKQDFYASNSEASNAKTIHLIQTKTLSRNKSSSLLLNKRDSINNPSAFDVPTTKTLFANGCDPLCYQCDANTSNPLSSKCKVCNIGVYLYKSRCYQLCPESTYADDEWQVCRDCDALCPVCWGPLSNMCGSKKGVSSRVVLIENEIKDMFPVKEINKEFVKDWIKALKIILENAREFSFGFIEDYRKFGNKRGFTGNKEKMNTIEDINSNSKSDQQQQEKSARMANMMRLRKNMISDMDLSPTEVYGNSKISLDLPFGSFSKNNGVFIPIPSYISNKINYVRNHWIYVKGQWNGFSWLNDWIPVLPSYIKKTGDKTKIYYENEGYWIFSTNQGK